MNYVTPQNIFDVFIALGGVAFIFSQINLGKANRKSNDEKDALTTIRLKDETIRELTSKVTRLESVVLQDGKDIAVLKSDKERLEALISNRNPELEVLMKQVIAALTDQTKAINMLLAKPALVTVNNQPQ